MGKSEPLKQLWEDKREYAAPFPDGEAAACSEDFTWDHTDSFNFTAI